jgi:hypothetical protein
MDIRVPQVRRLPLCISGVRTTHKCLALREGFGHPRPLIFARAICATHAHSLSARSIGFCVMWVCISSSSGAWCPPVSMYKRNLVIEPLGGRVGRAGAMRAIAKCMPQSACPRQALSIPGYEVQYLEKRTDPAKMRLLICSAAWRATQARHRPRHAAKRLPPEGSPDAHTNVLCRRHRRHNARHSQVYAA